MVPPWQRYRFDHGEARSIKRAKNRGTGGHEAILYGSESWTWVISSTQQKEQAGFSLLPAGFGFALVRWHLPSTRRLTYFYKARGREDLAGI